MNEVVTWSQLYIVVPLWLASIAGSIALTWWFATAHATKVDRTEFHDLSERVNVLERNGAK